MAGSNLINPKRSAVFLVSAGVPARRLSVMIGTALVAVFLSATVAWTQQKEQPGVEADAIADADRVFAEFSRPFLTALSKREYSDAVRLAQQASANPVLAPLREHLKGCEAAAARLRKFWASFPDDVMKLKGKNLSVGGATGELGAVRDGNLVLVKKVGGGEAETEVAIARLTTDEILKLTAASNPAGDMQTLLNMAWFSYAEGKSGQANAHLDSAEEAGGDTDAVRVLMATLTQALVEADAAKVLAQLRTLVEGKRWAEAQAALGVLRKQYSETKVVTLADQELERLQILVISSGAKLPRQWAWRFVPDKRRLIAAGGGNPAIEDAVVNALRWLKARQHENGSWHDKQPVAMTGLALLAFLAHGETPASAEFGDAVKRAITWLREQAERGNGRLGSRVEYETGIATYALAEAYGMTGDPKLRPVVEKCVETIISGQTKGGGWLYKYEGDGLGDMSVSGWQVQALKTAYLTGIKQKEITAALDKAMIYTKSVYGAYKKSPDKGGFGYRGPECKWTLTGTGLLCLLLWDQGGSEQAQKAARFLREDVAFGIGKDFAGKEGGKDKLYSYFYITQAMFLLDAPNGPKWKYWNSQFSEALLKTQNANGSFPIGDWNSNDLVYNTTLSTLMLQVYYRNLPSPPNPLKR